MRLFLRDNSGVFITGILTYEEKLMCPLKMRIMFEWYCMEWVVIALQQYGVEGQQPLVLRGGL